MLIMRCNWLNLLFDTIELNWIECNQLIAIYWFALKSVGKQFHKCYDKNCWHAWNWSLDPSHTHLHLQPQRVPPKNLAANRGLPDFTFVYNIVKCIIIIIYPIFNLIHLFMGSHPVALSCATATSFNVKSLSLSLNTYTRFRLKTN